MAFIVGCGLTKAILADRGKPSANDLDIAIGLAWAAMCVNVYSASVLQWIERALRAYCAGIIEAEFPSVAPWFFQFDIRYLLLGTTLCVAFGGGCALMSFLLDMCALPIPTLEVPYFHLWHIHHATAAQLLKTKFLNEDENRISVRILITLLCYVACFICTMAVVFVGVRAMRRVRNKRWTPISLSPDQRALEPPMWFQIHV